MDPAVLGTLRIGLDAIDAETRTRTRRQAAKRRRTTQPRIRRDRCRAAPPDGRASSSRTPLATACPRPADEPDPLQRLRFPGLRIGLRGAVGPRGDADLVACPVREDPGGRAPRTRPRSCRLRRARPRAAPRPALGRRTRRRASRGAAAWPCRAPASRPSTRGRAGRRRCRRTGRVPEDGAPEAHVDRVGLGGDRDLDLLDGTAVGDGAAGRARPRTRHGRARRARGSRCQRSRVSRTVSRRRRA